MPNSRLTRWSRFWGEAIRVRSTASRRVIGRVMFFTLWTALISYIHWNKNFKDLNIEVGPFEVVAAILGILMVLRTNAGYDRWWEGRKLWGGIVNQTRNLVIGALSYGKDDPEWRDRLVRRTVAFAHVARRSLRGERDMPEVVALLGHEDASRITSATHMPTAISRLLADDLRLGLDGFAFQQAEAQRSLLIDHIGGCERIMKTPLPVAYSAEIRRFIIAFLITLPFALMNKIGKDKVLWLAPLIEFFAAYPLLTIDKIGDELQDPFSKKRLNHLPLDDITSAIEANLLSNLDSALDVTRIDVPIPRPIESNVFD